MLKNKKIKIGFIIFGVAIVLIIIGLIMVGAQNAFREINFWGVGTFIDYSSSHFALAKFGIIFASIIGPILGFGSLIWIGYIYAVEFKNA